MQFAHALTRSICRLFKIEEFEAVAGRRHSYFAALQQFIDNVGQLLIGLYIHSRAAAAAHKRKGCGNLHGKDALIVLHEALHILYCRSVAVCLAARLLEQAGGNLAATESKNLFHKSIVCSVAAKNRLATRIFE